ncbi:MAG: radical SAM protein [Planctomycetes bacterium]|nr:radical SAM protein [Planctomycetota bacterium]
MTNRNCIPDAPDPASVPYEVGPIRPPSEAGSLLLRLTRNCPWNRCAFCHTYRGEKYGRRPPAEVLRDVAAAKAAAGELQSLSWEAGEGGELGAATIARLRERFPFSEAHAVVANFLLHGGRTAFLQDADPLAGPPEDTVAILRALRAAFPSLERVTTYCRSKTSARLGPATFRSLKEAGLDRVHTGMESGSDAVLELARKGATAEDHARGGLAVKEGGLELSEYWMPGLGGKALSAEHSRASAELVNRVRPDFVRLRTLAVVGAADLWAEVEARRFERLGDDEAVREIRDFVARIEAPVRLESDHVLNLLEELRGDLPGERDRLLGLCDAYLALPEPERVLFRIGRRLGAFRRLSDLAGTLRPRVEAAVRSLGIRGSREADETVWEMMAGFV